MGDYSEAFVGFDTSKLRNAVAIAEAGRGGEVRFFGEIENTPAATAKLVRKLSARYKRLTFCYEAGPTGYGLHRQIKDLGFECVVVAPSLIPKRPGDKVKTNRRDALSLAKLLRAADPRASKAPARKTRAAYRYGVNSLAILSRNRTNTGRQSTSACVTSRASRNLSRRIVSMRSANSRP